MVDFKAPAAPKGLVTPPAEVIPPVIEQEEAAQEVEAPLIESGAEAQEQVGETTELPEAQSQAQFEQVTDSNNDIIPTPTLEGKYFTCLPIRNLSFGKFKFKDGQLKLTSPEDIAQFDKLLASLPPIQRRKIRTIDMEKAQRIAASAAPVAIRGFDSGQNPAAEAMRRANPKIGKGNMGKKASGQNQDQ